MGILDGKIAVVVGAGARGNMGAEIARAYLREGAHVIFAGRTEAGVRAVAAESGGVHLRLDITDEDDVVAAAAELKRRHGRLDILANAVGIHRHGSIADMEARHLDDLLRTHVHGPLFLIKHLAPLMPRGGSVVMISSVSAEANNNPPGVGVYGATKAATNKLLQVAAIEYGAQGLRINAIAPGLVMTPMADLAVSSMGPALPLRMINRTPMGRLASIAEIAAAALFLVRDDCFLSGQVLQVNGGFHLFDAGVPANEIATLEQVQA